MTTIINAFWPYIALIVLVLVAYWQRMGILFWLAGLALIGYGFPMWETSHIASVVLVVFGIATFAMPFFQREGAR